MLPYLKNISGSKPESNTLIHSLNPRIKIFTATLLLIGLLINSNWSVFLLYIFFLRMVIYLSQTSIKALYVSLKPLWWLILISSMIHLFVTPGKVLIGIGFLQLTLEGLLRALFISIRVFLLIITTMLISITTTPVDIVDTLEYYLSPFKKIGLPTSQISFMLSLSLRFIPVISEEVERIKKAQSSRGADFSSLNFKQRISSLVSMIIPLIYSSLVRADDLTRALVLRNYSFTARRTRLTEPKITHMEIIALISSLLVFVLTFWL